MVYHSSEILTDFKAVSRMPEALSVKLIKLLTHHQMLNYEANWKAARAFVDVGEAIQDDEERAVYYNNGSDHGVCSRP